VVTPAQDYILDDWAGDHGNEVYEEGNEWKLMIDGNKSITVVFVECTLDQLDQVGKPIWVGDVITWDDVDNAEKYNVHIHKDGTYLENRIVNPGIEEYDFSSFIHTQGSGAYTVRIQAIADGVNYRHGPISVFSDPLEKVTLDIDIGKGLGEITPGAGTYLFNKDDVVDLAAAPNTDLKWEFEAWKGSVADYSEPVTTITMTSNQEVFAMFAGGFAGGSGTEGDPFEVEDADQLSNVRGYIDLCFIQTQDISLSKFMQGEGWEPISDFEGIYDGNSKEITNLKINRPNDGEVGLFGNLTQDAIVKNVQLKGAEVTGQFYVGLLVGKNSIGEIINCHAIGDVVGQNSVGGLVGFNEGQGLIQGSSSRDGIVQGEINVGGLVGENSTGIIRRSYSIMEVQGAQEKIGGLVGYNYGIFIGDPLNAIVPGVIEVSFASGTVIGSSGSEDIGGLVGANDSFGQINNCYATGFVQGTTNIGGLVGVNEGANNTWIKHSYSIGEIKGFSSVGGLVGKQNGNANTNNSYWDKEASGENTSAAGFGRTSEQMKKGTPNETIQGDIMYEDWNTEDDVWNFRTEEDYPIFKLLLFPIPPIIIFP